MVLQQELRGLLDQATASLPTATRLRDYFAPRSRSITTAGPNLDHPAWAKTIHGSDDVFVELDGDLIGVRLYDDRRGWGAYAELAVAHGTIADVEAVTGPLQAVPRAPGDSGMPTLAAMPTVGGHRLRVFVKHDAGAVKLVTVHFETPAT